MGTPAGGGRWDASTVPSECCDEENDLSTDDEVQNIL